jgi:ParB family chromosome partitioning protein
VSSPGNNRKALGRGLDSLLKTKPAAAAKTAEPGVEQVPLKNIRPNPLQPRHHFDETALAELAESIRTQGVLQPVLLRPAKGGYELIAGERRFRAAQRAGLTEIPALVRVVNDEKALELAIIENLQRDDLNPIEQARAFQELANRFNLTQEQIATRTGKERSSISNFLRLLKLHPEVQQQVEQGQLGMGHARALLSLDPETQRTFAQRIAEQGWSVRQVEERVAILLQPAAPAAPKPRDPNVRAAEQDIARALGTRVHIRDRKNRGTIEIEYNGLEEFQRIFEYFTR